ncbi:hypothetical protein M406DRAFT_71016 [Cryphonectria parasitica EP155]|uniref:Uncharacterized protein n=1 Tax=Cryphonectria parasitica (strain ATCC 38755 / EP155) TaxID=660469 RepID=A0A9P4Y0U5_CRYP1|nr:uncharacterized protein M406DRAFT_71016 [Cryphonectria parasitica EP155]KAF3764444.1 hypothetical protein M406DRAFT_71016 [Cryphonectria parasitica EP155]
MGCFVAHITASPESISDLATTTIKRNCRERGLLEDIPLLPIALNDDLLSLGYSFGTIQTCDFKIPDLDGSMMEGCCLEFQENTLVLRDLTTSNNGEDIAGTVRNQIPGRICGFTRILWDGFVSVTQLQLNFHPELRFVLQIYPETLEAVPNLLSSFKSPRPRQLLDLQIERVSDNGNVVHALQSSDSSRSSEKSGSNKQIEIQYNAADRQNNDYLYPAATTPSSGDPVVTIRGINILYIPHGTDDSTSGMLEVTSLSLAWGYKTSEGLKKMLLMAGFTISNLRNRSYVSVRDIILCCCYRLFRSKRESNSECDGKFEKEILKKAEELHPDIADVDAQFSFKKLWEREKFGERKFMMKSSSLFFVRAGNRSPASRSRMLDGSVKDILEWIAYCKT